MDDIIIARAAPPTEQALDDAPATSTAEAGSDMAIADELGLGRAG